MTQSTPMIQYSPKTTNSLAKDLTVFVGLVVNGVLDITILHDAAQELVARWPILGGTLVRKTNPYSFRSGDTIDFKSRTFDETIDNYLPVDFHVGHSEAPTYKTQPQGNIADELFHFDSLRPFNLLPTNLLTIRITCLKDATLLGFRVPHHFCDGESVYHVIKAYRDIVAGQQIQTFVMPPDVDRPLSKVLQQETKFPLPDGIGIQDVPHLLPSEKLLLGIRHWVRYVGYAISRMVGAKLGISIKSDEKLIHLPATLVEKWRNECQKELELTIDSKTREAPVISKLDVITAWFLQTAMSHVPSDNGPLDLMYNFSYRFALPTPATDELYLKNTYYELRIHWDSLSAFQNSTLASLALAIRTSVLRNKQPQVIKANLEFQEQHITELVAPGGKCMRLAFLPFVSSWTTFEYNGLDFSAALIGEGKPGIVKGDGKVVFTLPRVALPLGITVDPLAVVLKDGSGGYWIRANLSRTCWKGHGQELPRDYTGLENKGTEIGNS